MVADVAVLPKRGASPLTAVLDAEPGPIKLTIVGGPPILGDTALMQQLLPGRKLDSLTVCRKVKSLNISDDVQEKTWGEIQRNLTDQLKQEN